VKTIEEKYSFNKVFEKTEDNDPFKELVLNPLKNLFTAIPGATNVSTWDLNNLLNNNATVHRPCLSFILDATNPHHDKGLFFIARCADRRYWEYGYDWRFGLSVGDIMSRDGNYPLYYSFHCERDLTISDCIANINSLIYNFNLHLNNKNFKKEFNIDVSIFDVHHKREILTEKEI
jgi:hypothetical protein